jgi:1-acyl-sn-glycerol-3-phosphate acyltransferase
MKILYPIGWFLSRSTAEIIGGLKIYGRENVPKTGGFILAPNHISYYDPPFVGSCLSRPIYFFAKYELFKNRIFGFILRRLNALPVKRGVVDRQALKMAIEVIKQGSGLTMFPEGTRSKTDQFLEPKAGLGLIARHAECPIVPAYISNSNRLKSCIFRKNRVHIAFGKPLSANWVKSFEKNKEDYLAISNAVLDQIKELRDNFSPK